MMSRSCAYFVLTKDGREKKFVEVWGNITRELVWGPSALESWLAESGADEETPEDICGAAFIDLDRKRLEWFEREFSPFGGQAHPRVQSVYTKLLKHGWPNFDIRMLTGSEMHARVQTDSSQAAHGHRPHTVIEAAEQFAPISAMLSKS